MFPNAQPAPGGPAPMAGGPPRPPMAPGGPQPGGLPPQIARFVDPNNKLQMELVRRMSHLSPQDVQAFKAAPAACAVLKKAFPEIGFLFDMLMRGGAPGAAPGGPPMGGAPMGGPPPAPPMPPQQGAMPPPPGGAGPGAGPGAGAAPMPPPGGGAPAPGRPPFPPKRPTSRLDEI